jgi:predicted TIM-barrel fold metal-dependent hydrolase
MDHRLASHGVGHPGGGEVKTRPSIGDVGPTPALHGKCEVRVTIDGCAFHDWRSTSTLTPYMTEAWRELLERPGDLGGPVSVKPQPLHRHPEDDADTIRAELPDFRRNYLDVAPVDRVVLAYDEGLLSTGITNYNVARSVVQAANDWTIDKWLRQDDRLFGLVLIPTGVPEDAAAEIRRVGQNDRMVGVSLGTNPFARPFGHPIYHPIYRAAAELDLPLVIQVGSDALIEQLAPAVAGGAPATFTELDTHSAQPLVTHVASLISEGVFELFPRLKVLLVGGGAGWIPGCLWLSDYWQKIIRTETPLLRRPFSEYFVEHVFVATADLETPRRPERLAQLLSTVPGIERVLLYTSGYPKPGYADPPSIAARLPESWHEAVFRTNALDFFRWSRHESPVPAHATAASNPTS